MRILITCLGVVVTCSGCLTPRWHDGTRPLKHRITQVAVCAKTPDSLTVSGNVGPIVAFTDYGIKVCDAMDDKGNRLDLRGFQIFWAKALCFQVELSAPDPDARSIDLDLAFRSRSGIERITTTVPIERQEHGNFLSSLRGWELRE
jgi:hypothetical protein